MVAVPRQFSPWDGTEKCSGTVGAGTEDQFFDSEKEAEAIGFCRGDIVGEVPCPKLHDCLIFALLNNERPGVWGGTGPEDRRAIRKRYPLRRGKIPRPEWRVFNVGEPVSWFEKEELADDDEDV